MDLVYELQMLLSWVESGGLRTGQKLWAETSPSPRLSGEFKSSGSQMPSGTHIRAELSCSLGSANLLPQQIKGLTKTTMLAGKFPFLLLGRQPGW